jgi:hypothetical protein
VSATGRKVAIVTVVGVSQRGRQLNRDRRPPLCRTIGFGTKCPPKRVCSALKCQRPHKGSYRLRGAFFISTPIPTPCGFRRALELFSEILLVGLKPRRAMMLSHVMRLRGCAT